MSGGKRVVIGMDPHKRSVTIEVMAGDEQVLGGGRFGTDVEGFAAMLACVQAWPERVWAVEGCEGIGRHVAQRLLAAGEPVVDVPANLSARVRVFATGRQVYVDYTAASVPSIGYAGYAQYFDSISDGETRLQARSLAAPLNCYLKRVEPSAAFTRKS